MKETALRFVVRLAACLPMVLSACSTPELAGGVSTVTVGIHTDCPYGLVA